MKYIPCGEHAPSSSVGDMYASDVVKLKGSLIESQKERGVTDEITAAKAEIEQPLIMRGHLIDRMAQRVLDEAFDSDSDSASEMVTHWTDLEKLPINEAKKLAVEMITSAENAGWVGTVWMRNDVPREIVDAYSSKSANGQKTILKVRSFGALSAMNMTPSLLEGKLAEQLEEGEISEFSVPEQQVR